jgi:arylsulfatase A-like enzyme
MNNRVVANGSPLDVRFDNVALAARRAGYTPVMFGYTDQALDPRVSDGPDDPRLSTYEGVLPGFDCVLDLSSTHQPWVNHLRASGHDVRDHVHALTTEHERPEQVSVSAFLTDKVIEWIDSQEKGWFVHASYLRPHPPYSAAGRFAGMYHPDTVGEPIAPVQDTEPFHALMMTLDRCRAPRTDQGMRRMRSQYFGMVSHVDEEVGRLFEHIRRSGQWDNTVVVVTADHAELLGDHGLREKLGYWETSQHIPCIVRDPRHPGSAGTVVEHFTENVDVMPTLCEAMGIPVPHQCDGFPLTPFLAGEEPPHWRDAAHWEYDWRFALVQLGAEVPWPWKRSLEKLNLCVRRSRDTAYVQFGDGRSLCFDLAMDPTWRTPCTDDARILDAARAMLTWRIQMAERTLAGFLTENGGIGRWPAGVPWLD